MVLGLKSRRGAKANANNNGGIINHNNDSDTVKQTVVDEKQGAGHGGVRDRYSDIPLMSLHTFVLGVIISMGGFIFGYDTGQISGILVMEDFVRRFGQYGTTADGTQGYYFSNVRSGLIVALLSIGTLIGALIGAPIADRIGRKFSIIFWTIIFSIGVIIQVAAETSWVQVAMGRFVAGFGVGALSLLVPMYQSETSPRHIRGALVSCYQLFITLGIFVADCINYGTETKRTTASWRIPMAIGWLWAIILAVGMFFQRESPRYAYRHGRKDEARKTLSLSYGVPEGHGVIQEELHDIEEKMQEEEAHKATRKWTDILTGPAMFRRIMLGMVLQMFQQLTGANYFFYYGTTIFQSTGLNNSYVTAMILGAVNFGSTFLGLWFIERFGRRKCLIFGALWMFVCFIVFGSVGSFVLDYRNPRANPGAGGAMIAFACLFILAFASTWGPMVWSVIGELYPTRHRATGMALATASNWLWNFLLAFFTPFITDKIHFKYGYVFAGCNLIAAGIIFFFVIEPKGRSLEEIDTMYILGVNPMKSSHWDIRDHEDEIHRNPNLDLDEIDSNKSKNLRGEHVEDSQREKAALDQPPRV